MFDRTMILTTIIVRGSVLRLRGLPAGSDPKYSYRSPCISHWKSAACHPFLELCWSSELEPARQVYARRIASTPTTIFAATDAAMSSPIMSAVIAVCFALTLAQLSSLACAASRSGGTFVSYPYQRFRYGAFSPRHNLTIPARIPRRIGVGFLAPNLGRGRKMLFGTLSCAPQDLSLTQGPVSSTSGIPTFDVQIVNLCGVCAMGQIHVACGNWASATPVDPFVFTRLGYNDCLVNNGAPLSSQGSVSFQYSNSAMYPMSITSASSECHR